MAGGGRGGHHAVGNSEFGSGMATARRDDLDVTEIRRVMDWKARFRASWAAAARYAGCSEHALRQACDPGYMAVHLPARGTPGGFRPSGLVATALTAGPVAAERPAPAPSAPTPPTPPPPPDPAKAAVDRPGDPSWVVMVRAVKAGSTHVMAIAERQGMSRKAVNMALWRARDEGLLELVAGDPSGLSCHGVTAEGRKRLARFDAMSRARAATGGADLGVILDGDSGVAMRRRRMLIQMAGCEGWTSTALGIVLGRTGGSVLSDLVGLERAGICKGERGRGKTSPVLWALTARGATRVKQWIAGAST